MTSRGLTINRVAVDGPGLERASVEFRPGLNVIAGASNTGKTYVYQLIDFLLGSSRTPKPMPAFPGYALASIEIDTRGQGVQTWQRSLSGGDARVYDVSLDLIASAALSESLEAEHDSGNPATISGRCLTLSGLFGKELRRDVHGKKQSLSFRNLAFLTLIDEKRIITESSPSISGQYTEGTLERSVLGLLLTGVDDASVITKEKPAERKLRLRSELATFEKLRAEKELRLSTFNVDIANLPAQRLRLAATVEQAAELRANQQEQLNTAASHRDATWGELELVRSRRLFVGEQLKRLRLLSEHYASDVARLESTHEAGELFERLPTGHCPVCGHVPAMSEGPKVVDKHLHEFRAACAAELSKIDALSRDLTAGIKTLESEDGALAKRAGELHSELKKANAVISDLLHRKLGDADEKLTELVAAQTHLAEAAFVAAEVEDLRGRQVLTEKALKVRIPRTKLAKKVEASGTVAFCEIVEDLLRAWKFPLDGRVTWSDERFDLVIGSENRGDLGKGYRAITHAAFTIGLMRYCRAHMLPHPGVVVLDSPLNPFKGPDRDTEQRINQDVQDAFYANLASNNSGDQVIILENTEPPASVRSSASYVRFSGNPTTGRQGFFGPKSSKTEETT